MGKPKVIAVVGPTASGKSALGEYLAKKLHGEIISADSRQVYKGMKTISRAESGYMVGVADPRYQFSAGEYKKKAEKIMSLIYQTKKIPIVVGGAGFYIDTLLGRMQSPEVKPDQKLRAALAKKTLPKLGVMLKKLDSASYARVDLKNRPRITRAIEIATQFGAVPPQTREPKYDVLWVGLREPKNLKAGVEERLRRGMAAEAARLRTFLSRSRYQELGFEFKLLADYINKKISKKELVGKIANGERKYATRQMRWFKRNPDIHWVKNKTGALRLAKKFLA